MFRMLGLELGSPGWCRCPASSLIGWISGGRVGWYRDTELLNGGMMALSTDLLRFVTELPVAEVRGPTPSYIGSLAPVIETLRAGLGVSRGC